MASAGRVMGTAFISYFQGIQRLPFLSRLVDEQHRR